MSSWSYMHLDTDRSESAGCSVRARRVVFHTTDRCAADAICREGFDVNKSCCSERATWFAQHAASSYRQYQVCAACCVPWGAPLSYTHSAFIFF